MVHEDYGQQFFRAGDAIAFIGHLETPQDDWGVDTGPRGEYVIPMGATAIYDDNNPAASNLVKEFTLANNYPNPFNPVTTIRFTTPRSANVSLVIYNSLGQRVRTLVDNTVQPGSHLIQWNGKNDNGIQMPSGIYFYVLTTNKTRIAKIMMMIKY